MPEFKEIDKARKVFDLDEHATLKEIKSAYKKLSYEFIAFDIKNTMQALGEITGDDITEETLHAIFSRFCIGK